MKHLLHIILITFILGIFSACSPDNKKVVVIPATSEVTESFDDPEAMQEERRLFYVGITRAENQLYLLHSLNRYTYGYAEPADPSRFLADIPYDLLDDGRPGRSQRKKKRKTSGYEDWTLPAPKGGAAVPVIKKEFDPGMKVEHSVWGEGLVLTSKLDGEDEVVDVFFDSVGLKRVIASMAKLMVKQ